jgi:hypothetical protein
LSLSARANRLEISSCSRASHVDRKTLGLEHCWQAVSLSIDAEENERRINRHRVERTHGHADELFAAALRRNDRNAGCELA